MSLYRNRFALFLVVPALAFLGACGSSNNHATPPPTGGFSNSNLNGTYVFSITGTDAGQAPFAIAGTLTANGSGSITGGTLDLNDAQSSPPDLGVPITGGNYSITADGRGTGTLTAATAFGSSIGIDFVLSSNSHGLITQFDSNGSGSGTLDMQSTVTQAQLAGPYAFNMSGLDPQANFPFGTVGSFTLNSSGTITTGVEDFNDANLPQSNLTLSGSLVSQSSGAPFTASLTAATFSAGTLTFDVFPIDATHLKLIESDDGFPLLAGDAYTQQGATLPTATTQYVFTMTGFVQNSGPVAVGGAMSIGAADNTGAGSITDGLFDLNDVGQIFTAQNFLGSYLSGGSVGGRTLFNISGFATQLVGYPTANAGFQMLESDPSGFFSGAALPQSNTTFASGQGYGMNVTGSNANSVEDDIAEFTTTSTALSGLVDFNDMGTTSFDQRMSGNYQADTPPAGRYDFASNAFNGEVYTVDSTTSLFVELDTTQVAVGTLQLQNGTQASATSPHQLILPHPMVFPHTTGKSAAKWKPRTKQ